MKPIGQNRQGQGASRGFAMSIGPWMAVVLVALLHSRTCHAERFEFQFDALPASAYLDRWMYPFNVTPGTRIQAPTFGALGSEGFDERDGQFVLAVNTAALGIPDDLPPQQYQIHAATLVLTETFGGYAYDPTYDAFSTYLDPSAALYQEDDDEGRPLELYGLSLRGDYTEFAWPDGESSEPPAFGAGSAFGGSGKGTRNVFAADAFGMDVSNNVDSLGGGAAGFEPHPFAVAKLMHDEMELEAGESASAGTQWVFDMDVADADIQAYLARGLARGQLGFAATSLHSTGVQGMGDPFPNPATANHFAFDGPVLFLDVEWLDSILGDFDRDGLLTVSDIDMLSEAVRALSDELRFDLTSDGQVTDADRTYWIELAGSTLGDADLNGAVEFADFLLLSGNFGAAGGWMQGDFDGSGDVAFSDFLLLSQNFGQTPASAYNVPEPAWSGHCIVLLLIAFGFWSRTKFA